jgi:hypothetical protein
MTMDALLARTMVKLADTLVADFDVVDLLTLLTTRCVDLLEVDEAGLLIAGWVGTSGPWRPPATRYDCWTSSSSRPRRGPAWTAWAPASGS